MSNIKPGSTTITVTDPKLFDRIAEVKADTEAILAKLDKPGERPQEDAPRYFPRGYFP
jgi:hypothetical protein